MVEIFRAMDEHRKASREAAWERRSEIFANIASLGMNVHPRIINAESRHCRVNYPGGWVDFWPSSGRWCASPGKGNKPGKRGYNLEGLLNYLRARL